MDVSLCTTSSWTRFFLLSDKLGKCYLCRSGPVCRSTHAPNLLDGHNFLVSATEAGNLAIWNLDKRVLVTQYQNAHRGGVTSLQFFDREPLLLSSGQDNSVKLWIFDQQNGEPRYIFAYQA